MVGILPLLLLMILSARLALSLSRPFATLSSSAAPRSATFLLRFDGGSRPNPGPGGTGTVLYQCLVAPPLASSPPPGGGVPLIELHSAGKYLPDDATTNNVAEYHSLLSGLTTILSTWSRPEASSPAVPTPGIVPSPSSYSSSGTMAVVPFVGSSQLVVEGDSQLILRQVSGLYKVKVERLKPLQAEARCLLSRLSRQIILLSDTAPKSSVLSLKASSLPNVPLPNVDVSSVVVVVARASSSSGAASLLPPPLFDVVFLRHVPREQNKRADELANLAMDGKKDCN